MLLLVLAYLPARLADLLQFGVYISPECHPTYFDFLPLIILLRRRGWQRVPRSEAPALHARSRGWEMFSQ